MSIKLVENEIRRSLATTDPEVICISGRWGVGKTYAWNQILKEARSQHNGIALKRYAYVSLFGITSLEEFKYSIFENTVSTSGIGVEPSLQTLQTQTAEIAKLARKALPFLQQLPVAKNSIGGMATALSFLAVREILVCVDDIERRGDKLSMRDVLGLVSNLKEQKKCKIILIMNDDAEDKEKEQFKTYYEKVIDKYARFNPTATECVGIALPAVTATDRYLGECCVQLGISNIRVLKKIERFVRAVEPLVSGLDDQVLRQAVQTIVLMSWSVYEPEIAPNIEFLKNRQRLLALAEVDTNKPLSDAETAWNALLTAYSFTAVDEMDLALLDGIRDGYFDPDRVKRLACELDRKWKVMQSHASYRDAWDLFHYSFADNSDEVFDKMYTTTLENLKIVDPANLNSTVTLLKELGRADKAAVLIERYVAQEGETRDFYDLKSNIMSQYITDSDIQAVFAAKLASFKDDRDLGSVLLSMSGGWSPEDIELLYGTNVDGFYKLFKSHTGDTLRKIIANCFQFSRISNASEAERDISKRAKEALERIGRESRLNALRVRKYGVNVDEPAS